jgi:hypothetical protein
VHTTRNQDKEPNVTDPIIADLRRELEKAAEALRACDVYLARHAEMNAALHCSDRVMYSPLSAKVTAAYTGIIHALIRTADLDEPSVGDTDSRWARILWDLDRCPHGRHAEDTCGSCGGQSNGNPYLRPGDDIGYGLRGDRIVVPPSASKHDPANWRQPANDTTTPPA